jgi:thiamine pyrophosphate-dependent acetolactate synthase large subunit-like protein
VFVRAYAMAIRSPGPVYISLPMDDMDKSNTCETAEGVSTLCSARVEGDLRDGSFQTFAVMIDNTAGAQAERALRVSERRFRVVGAGRGARK